jgi:phosphoglycerol transferase MdoB-like AlkP superfamily enzyme
VIEPASREDEQKRFNDLVTTLEGSQTPVFVHVHMLGTHGPRFEIREQVFSAGQIQDADWMINFYDDSILNFDRYVGELFDYLADSGTLKNTIVIIYSDHGRMWTVHDRTPLLFWFPEGKHAGRINDNVQNIDIAPTILDYLGIPIPKWMAGQSLIDDDLIAPGYIFSSSVDTSLIEVSRNGIWVVDTGRKIPPFYQVGYVGLVACDQWFELYVKNPGMSHGKVKGHSGACAAAKALSTDEAERLLLEHLSRNGFDVSSFPGSIPVQFVE